MSRSGYGNLGELVAAAIGEEAASETLAVLTVDPILVNEEGPEASRALLAMAMNAVLFHDLLTRVPTGAAYVEDVRRSGGSVTFDHGALRTIRFGEGPTGALPAGEEAFTRIFLPLGYERAGVYPLDRLRMTGRAYAHRDLPQSVPQFFLSELHVDRFSPEFQAAARRVFGNARDPLGPSAKKALLHLSETGRCPMALAAAALPEFAAAFSPTHATPSLADYQILLSESAEAAWIATEGAAFNHATDRVADVVALAEGQRKLGRPIKDEVEFSSTGRVRQTAFKADPVARQFIDENGESVRRTVPGSFYEFITRDPLPGGGGRLDLAFDASNAQGIFKMTAAEKN
jgi:hypothetical protein